MKSWRLTRRAEHSLTDIAAWTIDRFGPEQADKYRRKLIHKIDQLALGNCASDRSCAVLVNDVPGAEALQFILVGRHYVIYREEDDELQVIDFVNGARDLEAILKELT